MSEKKEELFMMLLEEIKKMREHNEELERQIIELTKEKSNDKLMSLADLASKNVELSHSTEDKLKHAVELILRYAKTDPQFS